MVHSMHVQGERVSPSMVQSVFGQLKSNGYTDGQIVSLSLELSELAHRSHRRQAGLEPRLGEMPFEVDLSELAWLPHR